MKKTDDRDLDPEDLLGKGYVVVDKPPGPTSHEVVSWVKEMVGVEKAAHTGTLDPGVTGCLPVLLGKSARVSGLFRGADKEYVFVLRLHGDTYEKRVGEVFDEFEGEIYQRPPKKSSVRRRVRTREIESLDVLETDLGDNEDNDGDGDGRRILGRVRCGAGTYIRKLCHDIGLALGTGGHMEELRRTASGGFCVEDAVYLQDLSDSLHLWREEGDETELRRIVEPLEDVLLAKYPAVEITDEAVAAVAHGAPVYEPGVVAVSQEVDDGDTAVAVSGDGEAVCVGKVRKDDVFLEPDHVVVDADGYGKIW
ncbi:MAG: RNA-guided pseudouridylation complex pseudouridine synthase subunit Cbf5 [Halobacteria archaeon]|nr:RNA-guided pseudouridylation complex pseudouridine synthase subunit Cbf5 [Halobacteria archaeon]